MSNTIQHGCSWCGALNDITEAHANKVPVFCGQCGHRADVPQDACDCQRCVEAKRLIDIPERAGTPQPPIIPDQDNPQEEDGLQSGA